MHKPLKNKKDKVPKITEAEYTEYISHLREEGENKINTKETAMQKQNIIEEK